MWLQAEWWFCGWTVLAALWWLMAYVLVARSRRVPPLKRSADSPSLSIFKPVPALGDGEVPPRLVAALESFIQQLDEHSELLLGFEKRDQTRWEPVVDNWRRKYPQARLNVTFAPQPNHFPNPKISWEHTLAPRARGKLWLWSDADIIAPAGTVAELRDELGATNAALVTAPYVVRDVRSMPALIEALYVNMELYPGARLLQRLGSVRCAFGSCLLFAADSFRQQVVWERLGSVLAEDFTLGNSLQPVTVSSVTLESLATETRWGHAIGRYLRWHKGVRWCRPAGYAGLLMILPLIGWLTFAVSHPAAWSAWLGAIAVMQMEVLTAWAIFRRIGCRLKARHVFGLELWCLLRPLVWIACWFPWPVVWRPQRRMWWGLDRSTELVAADRQPPFTVDSPASRGVER